MKKRTKTSWKKILLLAAITLLLFAAIYAVLKYVGIPLPIKKEVTASQIVVGEDRAEPVDVKINGILRIFIGSDNRFEGKLEIDSYEGTKGAKVEALGYDGVYVMKYESEEIGMGVLISDSLLWSEFALQVDDGLIFGDGKNVVVYPQVDPDAIDEKITEIRRAAGWQEELLSEEVTETNE